MYRLVHMYALIFSEVVPLQWLIQYSPTHPIDAALINPGTTVAFL